MSGTKIGFMGLGEMGFGMAVNMQKDEPDFMIISSSQQKREYFANLGAAVAADLSELGQNDIIFLCLPGGKEVEQAIFGEDGMLPQLKEGSIIVDFSTISYITATKICERLAQKEIIFLDCPISGMKKRADDGTLTVMCGGDETAFQKVKPYLDKVGNKVLYMGQSGQGQLAKLINQLLFDINLAAIAEILPMAAKMGVDCGKITQVINSGTGRSYASEFFIPRILEGSFEDGYSLKNAYKDLQSASQISAEHAIPMPVLAAATATYQSALQKGFGEDNKGGMIKVFEQLLGVEFRK